MLKYLIRGRTSESMPVSSVRWLQSRLNRIHQCNTITCWLKGNLIPGQVPLSKSVADGIRYTSNQQTIGSCVPALIQSLSAGREGPCFKLCSHQDQTGTVPLLLTAQIKGRIYLQALAPKHSSRDSHTQFQKELWRKSRTCTSPLTHLVPPDLFACVHF